MSDITVNNFKAFYEQIRPYLGAVHSGFTPIGTVISVMGTTAPLNYLACDGTVYNISDYPELAAYFNQQFGASNHFGGNGTTTFAVPDLRGEFLRGTGTNSHANQGSGANVGVHQDGTRIPISYCTDFMYQSTHEPDNKDSNVSVVSDMGYDGKKNISSSSWGNTWADYTTRPTNTSVLYCIASKNIFMDAGSNYSTEEQVVGTWIDGKPIYQKTVNCGALPNNTSKDVAHGISDIDKATAVYGYGFTSTGGIIPLPYVVPGSYATEYVALSANRTNVSIGTGKDRSSLTGYVTLQYTKTTD